MSGYSMPPLWWTAWIAIFIFFPVICIVFVLVPYIACHCLCPCFMSPIMCIWALNLTCSLSGGLSTRFIVRVFLWDRHCSLFLSSYCLYCHVDHVLAIVVNYVCCLLFVRLCVCLFVVLFTGDIQNIFVLPADSSRNSTFIDGCCFLSLSVV